VSSGEAEDLVFPELPDRRHPRLERIKSREIGIESELKTEISLELKSEIKSELNLQNVVESFDKLYGHRCCGET